MLNKFTLQFKDQQLEDQYQNYQNKTHRLPMFKQISIVIFIAVTYIMVTMFINGALINKILSFGLFATTIILILIVKKKQQFVRCALIIFNHLLIITSFEQDNQCSQHYYYLRGITMMAAHMIIAMSGEFLDSLFSIVSIFTVRLLLLFLQDKIFPYSTVVIAVLLPVYLIYQIYQTNQGFRSQFQLACIDSQWDKILTTLIDGAYLLMEFNPNMLTFKCKKSNKFQYTCNSCQELKDFLRNNHIGKVTLEKFFSQLLQSRTSLNKAYLLQQIITARIENQTVILQYSIFFGHRPMILLQICRCVEEGIIQEEKYAKIESSYQSKYQKLLKLALVQMKTLIKDKNNIKLITLFKQIFYCYLKENLKSQRDHEIFLFNLQPVLHIIKLIYKKKFIIDFVPSQVLGNRLIVCKLLIDIIESQTCHLYMINFKHFGSNYQIIIEGTFSEKKLFNLKKKLKPHLNYLKDIIYDQSYIKLIFSNQIADTNQVLTQKN